MVNSLLASAAAAAAALETNKKRIMTEDTQEMESEAPEDTGKGKVQENRKVQARKKSQNLLKVDEKYMAMELNIGRLLMASPPPISQRVPEFQLQYALSSLRFRWMGGYTTNTKALARIANNRMLLARAKLEAKGGEDLMHALARPMLRIEVVPLLEQPAKPEIESLFGRLINEGWASRNKSFKCERGEKEFGPDMDWYLYDLLRDLLLQDSQGACNTYPGRMNDKLRSHRLTDKYVEHLHGCGGRWQGVYGQPVKMFYLDDDVLAYGCMVFIGDRQDLPDTLAGELTRLELACALSLLQRRRDFPRDVPSASEGPADVAPAAVVITVCEGRGHGRRKPIWVRVLRASFDGGASGPAEGTEEVVLRIEVSETVNLTELVLGHRTWTDEQHVHWGQRMAALLRPVLDPRIGNRSKLSRARATELLDPDEDPRTLDDCRLTIEELAAEKVDRQEWIAGTEWESNSESEGESE